MLTLYTVGHSNWKTDGFVDLLRGAAITAIADVRRVPASRHVPHFARKRLLDWLPAHGIAYHFFGDTLGGRYDPPVPYAEVMQRESYREGIARLLEQVAQTPGRLAVMCSEGDPAQCHRHHLIARSLLDDSVRVTTTPVAVVHLLRDGTLKPVTAESFRTLL